MRGWLGPSLLVVALLVHALLVHDLIMTQTPTLDEVAHLPAGQSYLEQGTFGMYRHSPPGARLLAAVAALPSPLALDYEGGWRTDEPANHWRFAFETISRHLMLPEGGARYLRAFDWARHATLLWSLLAVVVLYVWGKSWIGESAGVVAAFLWALCPNAIGHASLVTTDVAAASAGLVSLFLFSRWVEGPSWRRAAWASASLGVAQWVKHSSLWLYIIVTIWTVAVLCTRRSGRWGLSLGWLGIVGGSVLALNAGYLFEGTFTRLGEFRFLSGSLTRELVAGEVNADVATTNNLTYRDVYARRVNRFRGGLLGSLPVPLPFHYVAGFDEQKFEAEGKYPMYLRGVFSEPIASVVPSGNVAGLVAGNDLDKGAPSGRRGWWYYYLYALAVKVPIGTWLIVGAGLLGGFLCGRVLVVGTWLLLALVPIVSMSFLTDINLGLRYVLGCLPFLFLIGGMAASSGVLGRVVVGVGLVWNGLALAGIHPLELSYFNESVGGPAKGRFQLIDSNLDWGQDLRRLARWLERHPEWSREIAIAYAGSVPKEFEGIESSALVPRDLRFVPDRFLFPWEDRSRGETWGPRPGKFAVSVNFERGMRFHTPISRSIIERYGPAMGGSLLPGSMMANMPRGSLAYFQEWTPIIEPEVGYSILLYSVSLEEANRVRRKMGLADWEDR
jgi:hypothetical protein